jgi:REP element-mobilizing transposase RayT
MLPVRHPGWHSRGYIPHFDEPWHIQFLTFRLSDSIPAEILNQLQVELRSPAYKRNSARIRHRVESMLDQGHGSCLLKEVRFAELVQNALLYFDTQRYRILAWVIMPNHVHVLAEIIDGWPLGRIMHSWKSYTAHEINKALGKTGPVWQREYFDRYIRDDRHYSAVIEYIHRNPVKAGLVKEADEWEFSSSRYFGI